ncbi:hypothetical protein Tco_1361254 [Tanacetum coccineum]
MPKYSTTPYDQAAEDEHKQKEILTLDPNWNTIKTVDDALEQSWFNEMIQVEKPPLTFDELMITTIELSAFAKNRLKLNKITRADLVGQVFNLLKGTCKSCVELEYNMEECCRTLTDQLDWTDLEGHKSLVDMSKLLPLQDKEAVRYTLEGIKDMIPTLWIPFTIAYDKDAALGISHWGLQCHLFYIAMINRKSKHEVFLTMRILSVFKECDFLDLHLNDIEDMLLLIPQNKLFNLDGDVIVDFVTTLKMFTRGIIVKNRVKDVQLDNSKKKRLMRVDDIHKFCDKTLQSVHNILHESLLNFKFSYNKGMPSREWTTKDKRCKGIILNKINDLSFKRHLEVLVGGRKT